MLVKDMHQELKSWGHPSGGSNPLILKSDGEPAVVTVREALARCHGGRVTPEGPPLGEQQANGTVEEAGRTIRDQARVLKVQLQVHIGREIEANEPIMPWLIRWAAMSVSRFKEGKDGKTPYQRLKGRKCDLGVVHSARRSCIGYRKWPVAVIKLSRSDGPKGYGWDTPDILLKS